MYNQIVLDHFQNPRNLSELNNPDAYGTGANPICGDVLKLYLIIKDGKIEQATFKTMGCGAVIASGSILTEHLKNKLVADAQKIKPKDLVDLLGGLPPIKLHCPDLAVDALKSALKIYDDKHKKASK
ncbi:iron-sulfur cluster assembly scaffold protein [bacterium F11]|nr:iron-sulfur cluster assembly scaffold protein [bacterium F11]